MRFEIDFAKQPNRQAQGLRLLLVMVPGALLAVAAAINVILSELLNADRAALNQARSKLEAATSIPTAQPRDRAVRPAAVAQAIAMSWDDFLTYLESLSRPGWHVETMSGRAEDGKVTVRLFQSADAADAFPSHALEAMPGSLTARIVSHERTEKGVRWTIEVVQRHPHTEGRRMEGDPLKSATVNDTAEKVWREEERSSESRTETFGRVGK